MKTEPLPVSPEEGKYLDDFWNSLSKEEEETIMTKIKEGKKQALEGKVISHEEAMAHFNNTIAGAVLNKKTNI